MVNGAVNVAGAAQLEFPGISRYHFYGIRMLDHMVIHRNMLVILITHRMLVNFYGIRMLVNKKVSLTFTNHVYIFDFHKNKHMNGIRYVQS